MGYRPLGKRGYDTGKEIVVSADNMDHLTDQASKGNLVTGCMLTHWGHGKLLPCTVPCVLCLVYIVMCTVHVQYTVTVSTVPCVLCTLNCADCEMHCASPNRWRWWHYDSSPCADQLSFEGGGKRRNKEVEAGVRR